MGIFHPLVRAHTEDLARRGEDPLLAEMHDHGRERGFPFVGPEVGRFLFQLVRLMGAHRVFEMGSGFGYSALWFARALPEDGEIFLCDSDPENLALARNYLARDGQAIKAHFLAGHAQDMLQAAPGLFDILFCDIDKEQYPDVYELARARLRLGGALVADNLLWDGRVADPDNREPATFGIRAFTDRMWESPEFFSSLLPIRDGVGLFIKVK